MYMQFLYINLTDEALVFACAYYLCNYNPTFLPYNSVYIYIYVFIYY